jgi:hypothetical protein
MKRNLLHSLNRIREMERKSYELCDARLLRIYGEIIKLMLTSCKVDDHDSIIFLRLLFTYLSNSVTHSLCNKFVKKKSANWEISLCLLICTFLCRKCFKICLQPICLERLSNCINRELYTYIYT